MHLVFFLVLLHLTVLLNEVSGGLYFRSTRDPVTIIPRSKHDVLEQWIVQQLDNFNKSDDRTWKMRYMLNNEHFEAGGPILIYIGGEWKISPEKILGGQAYDIAKQHKAMMFYTEHRYYGQSFPTPDSSTKNLQYLSVDQALADLAHFVKHMKHIIPGLQGSKVIVIGKSYAASMATWFRLKYPHLVDIALASSGPLLAIADFYQYLEVLGRSLKSKGGPQCYETVKKGMEQLLKTLNSPDGSKTIAEKFNLCKPIKRSHALDMATFTSDIADAFASVVQYHMDGDTEQLCDKLQVELDAGNSELQAIATFVKEDWEEECHDSTYQALVDAYKDPSWDKYTGLRQWFYQSCTEFGFFQTDLSKDQPFGSGINNLNFYINLCKDLFGEQFTRNARKILEDGVKKTNRQYGGLTPAVTKVIFTHGTTDPWHALGVLKDLNEEAPAIVIPGTAHCMDLLSLSENDSPEMKAAKLRVQQIITKWLQEENDPCIAENSASPKFRTKKHFRNRNHRAKNRDL